MKKICFFCSNYGHSGGTERVSTAIANGLAEQGYEVVMLSLFGGFPPFFEQHPSILNAQLYSTNVSFTKHYFATLLKLRAFVKAQRIDTLIAVESMLALYSLPAVMGLKIKHITWEHFNYNVDLGRKTRRIARHLSRLLSDKIVTLTERDKEIWLKNSKGSAEIMAIPNPSPYAISDNTPLLANKRVLAIGRLTYQKGFDLLLQAWQQFKAKPDTQDWQLQIVGEGETKAQLEALLQSLNIQDSVSILPFSNNVSSYYQNASIYCMSSRFEGLPMVLIESLSFGLPIVSFDCDTGPSDIIENGKNGYLCQPNNIQDLADKLHQLAMLNEKDYLLMSENSKKSAVKFNPKMILQQWREIL